MKSKFFNSFFDNSIEGIILIEEGFIRDINNSMLDILNYNSKEEVINNLATGILIPNINQKFLEFNYEVFEEISLLSKNGNIIPAIIKVKDEFFQGKQYKLVFVLNLTELKNKESLLLEQSRMAAMGEMISMIAHQWRQPLSSIAAAISNLRFRSNLNKLDKKNLEDKLTDIDKYIHYMSNTIDDFRNFFKGDKDKEQCFIVDTVEVALEMTEAYSKKISFIHEKRQLNKIYILKNELLQVILNLLNNSKDAFFENRISDAYIKICYEENEDEQIIIIEDNAGGISKDVINKIFDPYFSTKNKKNGTGIGLYMSKTIIEKHFDGTISVKSNNNITQFRISINKFN